MILYSYLRRYLRHSYLIITCFVEYYYYLRRKWSSYIVPKHSGVYGTSSLTQGNLSTQDGQVSSPFIFIRHVNAWRIEVRQVGPVKFLNSPPGIFWTLNCLETCPLTLARGCQADLSPKKSTSPYFMYKLVIYKRYQRPRKFLVVSARRSTRFNGLRHVLLC